MLAGYGLYYSNSKSFFLFRMFEQYRSEPLRFIVKLRKSLNRGYTASALSTLLKYFKLNDFF